MAHEMSHVRNYDIRLMLLMAVMVGTIVMLSDCSWQMLWFGASRRRSRGEKQGRRAAGAVMAHRCFVLAVVLAILAPDPGADHPDGHEPPARVPGRRLGRGPDAQPRGPGRRPAEDRRRPGGAGGGQPGTAHLYIVHPIKKFEDRALELFDSHPPIKERIARLEALVQVVSGCKIRFRSCPGQSTGA